MSEREPEPAAEETAPDSLTGLVIGERYRVDELLGEGGMGAVYRATHVLMRKPVAIKVLHREMTLNDEARQRFEREAVASARIEHPHVTGASDFGKLENGSCYLVLDYVAGHSLSSLLKSEGALAVDRALAITRQMVLALQAAHAVGVVHRDLKPDNVMLVEQGEQQDFVKVLDFGIAKLETDNTGTTAQLTKAGAVYGTPEYMSPEQASGTTTDVRSDLYTVGVMLFEMLSGATPFQAETMIGVLTQHLTEKPPPLPAEIPPPLKRIVKKLLEKEPGARFQSATELLTALDGVTSLASAVTIPPNPELPGKRLAADAVAKGAALTKRVDSWFRRAAEEARRRSHSSLGQWPSREVRVGSTLVPLWIAAAAPLLGVLLLVMLWPGDEAPSGPAAQRTPAAEEEAPPDEPEAPAIDLDAATAGDVGALDALDELKARARTAAQWRALAMGRFATGDLKSAAALNEAVEAHPKLADDESLLAVAYRLGLQPETSELGLEMLAERFGEAGADVVDAIAKELPKGASADAKRRVKRAVARSLDHQSKALAVARELRDAKGCKTIKDLLPRAIQHADERSVAQLTRRRAKSGCGFLGLQDCFRCLRGSGRLSEAIEAAEGRPAPKLPQPAKLPKRDVPVAGSPAR